MKERLVSDTRMLLLKNIKWWVLYGQVFVGNFQVGQCAVHELFPGLLGFQMCDLIFTGWTNVFFLMAGFFQREAIFRLVFGGLEDVKQCLFLSKGFLSQFLTCNYSLPTLAALGCVPFLYLAL